MRSHFTDEAEFTCLGAARHGYLTVTVPLARLTITADAVYVSKTLRLFPLGITWKASYSEMAEVQLVSAIGFGSNGVGLKRMSDGDSVCFFNQANRHILQLLREHGVRVNEEIEKLQFGSSLW
jgi:hypothetical protein